MTPAAKQCGWLRLR